MKASVSRRRNTMKPSFASSNPEALFGEAKWIWPVSLCWDLSNCYALFRREFQLDQLPVQALLAITADQSYQLYINGRYVCRGPARGFQERWPYDEVDIRPFLQQGRNVLAIRAHHPGTSNFQYVSHGYAGLLVAGAWPGSDLRSDRTWKTRRQTGVNRAAVPTSIQLFAQEHIDLREEDPNWMQPDFDDSGWVEKVSAVVWNSMPWYSLEPRGIPLLAEKNLAPALCLGRAAGRCAAGFRTTRDVTRTRFEEGLSHRAETEDAKEVVFAASVRGRYQSVLLDFGKTVVGSLGLFVEGARGGEIFDTLHGEALDEKTGDLLFRPDTHSQVALGHRLICRPGTNEHTFYHAFGFRYVVLTVRDSALQLRVSAFLRTAVYPLARTGSFHSSEQDLVRIWEACAWTQQCCSLDAYVDTPWREQAQWWGDARVQAKNTFFLSGDARLFQRGLRQIAMQRTPDGLTYGHAPTIAHRCILPDFTLIWLITLWDYYWQTGSLEPFLEHQEAIEQALRYFEQATDQNTGLLVYDDRYWLFLDWAELPKNQKHSAVYNLWLLIALQKLIELFRAAGLKKGIQRLRDWRKRLRLSIRTFLRDDGLVCDGFSSTSRLVQTSIHAQTLAIMAGLDPARDEVRLKKALLPYLKSEAQEPTDPSSYWSTYVYETMAEAGYGRAVVETIRRKWRGMADYGATWETFSPSPGVQSYSHAWSAHPLFHLMQILGGIRQTGPAWRTIDFCPTFVGDQAKIVVPTPQGEVVSRWVRRRKVIQITLKLPPGITARILLPGCEEATATGTTKWSINPTGKI